MVISLPRASTAVLAACLVLTTSCEGCEDTTETGESFAGATGSVANAENLTMRPVTDDGYQIIEATPEMRRRAEQAEREAQEEYEDLVLEPTSPDPHGGEFTLDEALEGLGTDGTLVAEIQTGLGTMLCDLYTEKAPNTVANFIGLARGKRQWWDARAGQWRTRPYYYRTTFHRVIPNFLIQGGDYLGGRNGPLGYTIPDEPHDELRHDEAGLLCMASTDVDENAGQFFITDGPAPQLDTDSRFTIFGKCRNTDVIYRVARVPQDPESDNRPRTPVVIERILVRRVVGGAESAMRTLPQRPEGYEPGVSELQASPGPAELAIPGHARPEDYPGGMIPTRPRMWIGGMRPGPVDPGASEME